MSEHDKTDNTDDSDDFEDLDEQTDRIEGDEIERLSYADAREKVEWAKRTGDVISIQRMGAAPYLRFTPYENNRGVRVNMWSCISCYFEAMPERTLLNASHIVRPSEHDDWEINQIHTPWVVNQLAGTPRARVDVVPVRESPFGGEILKWSDPYELPAPDDERYVCIPCREMKPRKDGEIVVPGGTAGTVWCPWCGDKMDRYEEDVHGY